jgi:two-component system sensor histidine kinase/response regulator
METPKPEVLQRILQKERAARKEAEKILEGKSRELYEANQRLQGLARELEERVRERTTELEEERNYAVSTAQSLRASEKRYNDIAAVVGEYFWEMDLDLRFTDLTAQASRVFGYSRSELLGKSFLDFMEEEEADQLRKRLRTLFEDNHSFTRILVRIIRKDGEIGWHRLGGAPVFDDQGALTGYRGAGLDVTEEEQVKSNLEVLALAMEHASEGLAITDAEGRFTYLNQAHVGIYGYENVEELIGKHWSLLYTDDEAARLNTEIGRQFEETGSFAGEAEGLRKDGSVFPEIFSLQPLPNGGLLCICRDDTERRRVFMELQTQNSLRAALLDNIQTGILYDDARSQSTLLNLNLYRLFSVDEGDETLRKLDCVGFFERIKHRFKDSREFMEEVRHLLDKKVTSTNREALLRDGRFLAFDYIPVLVGNEFRGHLWAFRDISETKNQQRVLEEARHAAELGTMAKSAFLANMSHEIRTPLNGIIGMNRLLMKEPLNDNQLDYSRAVDHSARSLLGIIDDILDFSKIEAGRLEIEVVKFSLPEALDRVYETLRPRAMAKDIKVTLIHDPLAPEWVKGDPSRLRQVLINLLGNAVKFTDKGHVCMRVKTLAQSDDTARIEFSIEDTGIGIDEESISQIFQPFGQAEMSIARRFGGTGLGLAISRNLVDLMNGDILVESQVGEGSIFRVILPFDLPEGSVREHRPFEDAALTLVVTARDVHHVEALSAMLRMEGAKTLLTSSVREAAGAVSGIGTEEKVIWIILDEMLESSDRAELSAISEGLPESAEVLLVLQPAAAQADLPSDRIHVLQRPIMRWKLVRRVAELAGLEDPFEKATAELSDPIDQLDLSSMDILFAEDNTINQKVGRISLERMGASVDIASNGLEVLEMLGMRQYDLIFMDIRMPEMDGLEACRRIRRMGLDIPIIALTADAMKGDRERFLAAGMNAYLSKPLMDDQLANVMRDLFPRLAHKEEPIPSGQVSEGTVLEIPTLLRVLGNDKDMAKLLLDEFQEQSTELIERGASRIDEGDLDGACSVFHQLAGSANSIQALQLADRCLALERQLKKGDPGEAVLREAVAGIQDAFDVFKKQKSIIDWSE